MIQKDSKLKEIIVGDQLCSIEGRVEKKCGKEVKNSIGTERQDVGLQMRLQIRDREAIGENSRAVEV